MNSETKPQPRETWQAPEGSTWAVMSVKDGAVGLSGPGPCRSYQAVPLAEMTAQNGWTRVREAPAPRPKRVILTPDDIRGLTLHRPWPWCFTHADKRVENRPKPPPRALVGKWLALHSGKHFADGARARMRMGDFGRAAMACPAPHECPDSVITCIAQVRGYYRVVEGHGADSGAPQLAHPDTHELITDPWVFGPIVIETPRVIVLPEPVPCPGMQGYWRLDGARVPAGVFDRVREQVAAVTAAEARTA